MRRWIYAFVGVAGISLAIVLHSMAPPLLVGFLIFGVCVILINYVMSWAWTPIILGILLMLVPFPAIIGQYPTSRQLLCEKVQIEPPLANCHIELKTLSGWGNYRKDYMAIKQMKVMTVNAKRRPGKRSTTLAEYIVVQLSPIFMVDRAGHSHKLEKIEPHQPTATSITTQVNQFLKGPEPSVKIDIMEVTWAQDFSGGGTKQPPQRGYIGFAVLQALVLFSIGAVLVIKTVVLGS